MSKKDQPPLDPAELAGLRAQIDTLDDRLIALLNERIGIVRKVGEFKRRTAPGQCPIRPGREADMVRRVIAKCDGAGFPAAAAADLWRTLIGASTAVEGNLTISVFAPEGQDALFWLSREYFGASVPVIRQPNVKRILGDLMDGKASVGLVPTFSGDDTTYWWTNLIQQGTDLPRIFAILPFVQMEGQPRDFPQALAVARIQPEATAEDISLVVLEADHNTSQNRLQTALQQAKLEARWVTIASLHPASRHHLLEIKGFITPTHPAMQALAAALGNAIVNISFLGAYAVPVALKSGQPAFIPPVKIHASNSPKA
jgi:chorismate mutase / prephenate dehydratase